MERSTEELTDYLQDRFKKLEKIKYPYEWHDGSIVFFAKGDKDEWCVYYAKDDGNKCVGPFKFTDIYYFNLFVKLADQYDILSAKQYENGRYTVYGDVFQMSQEATRTPDESVIGMIKAWECFRYNDVKRVSRDKNSLVISVGPLFLILYYAMVSEENCYPHGLASRIKNLAMYQILIQGMDVYKAAKFSNREERPVHEVKLHCDAAETWWSLRTIKQNLIKNRHEIL